MTYALYKKVGDQYKRYSSENFNIIPPATYLNEDDVMREAYIHPLLNSIERWNRTDIIYCVDLFAVGSWRLENDIFFDNSGKLETGEIISDLASSLFADNITKRNWDQFNLDEWSQKNHTQDSIWYIYEKSSDTSSSLSKYLQNTRISNSQRNQWVQDLASTVVRWAHTNPNWEPSFHSSREVYGKFTNYQYFWAGWRQYSEEDQWVKKADFLSDLNKKNISMCIVDHSGSNPEPNELNNYEFPNTDGFNTNPWGLKEKWQWGNPTAFFARTMIPFPKAMDISAGGIYIEETDVISIMELMNHLKNEKEGKSIFIQWPASFKNVSGKWWDISNNGKHSDMWMSGKKFIDYFSIDAYPFSPLVNGNRNWYFQTSNRQEEKYAWGLIDGMNADGEKVSHVPEVSEVENIYVTKPAQVLIYNHDGTSVTVDVSWNTFYRTSGDYNSSIILSNPPEQGAYGELIVPILKVGGNIFEYQGPDSIDLTFNSAADHLEMYREISKSWLQNFEDDLTSLQTNPDIDPSSDGAGGQYQERWWENVYLLNRSSWTWPSNNSIRWTVTHDGINNCLMNISQPLNISELERDLSMSECNFCAPGHVAKSVKHAMSSMALNTLPEFSLPDKILAKNGTDEFIIRHNDIMYIPALHPQQIDSDTFPVVEEAKLQNLDVWNYHPIELKISVPTLKRAYKVEEGRMSVNEMTPEQFGVDALHYT